MLTPETKETLRRASELINKMIGLNADRFSPDVVVMTDAMYEHLCNHIESTAAIKSDGNLFIGGQVMLNWIMVKHFPTPEICQTQATWMKIKGKKVLLVTE